MLGYLKTCVNDLFHRMTQESELSTPTERWQIYVRRARELGRKSLPFFSGAFAVLIALFIYGALTPPPDQITQAQVVQSVADALASATPPPPWSALVYRVIQPSIVLVQTQGINGEQSTENHDDDSTDLHFTQMEGIGTGVVVSQEGDILTSLHIVAGAGDILVTFADGTESRAEIVGAQPEIDIAVLRALQPPPVIVPATLGNPNAMRIGDEAFVVGHPFGLYGSMSAGVISGLHRTYQMPDGSQTLEDLIQVDAAVNQGASGGPLLNRAGHVIGIVTVILNPTGQNVFIGIGFAVPITTAGGGAGLPPH